jgi:hypothetical protein
MKVRALLLSAVILIGTAACHDSSEVLTTSALPPGAMSYTAFDDQGRLVVTGWILLHLPDAAAGPGGPPVTGAWNLHALVDPGLVGWQQGHGNLEGDFRDGLLVVSLYPGSADSGCFLGGVLTFSGPEARMAYAGTWNDQSFTGPHFTGTFQAKQ